jgi:hypothetical protein
MGPFIMLYQMSGLILMTFHSYPKLPFFRRERKIGKHFSHNKKGLTSSVNP